MEFGETLRNALYRDLPGGPVVKTTPSSAGGLGLSPGWGGKITHVLQSNNQNINNKS